MKRHGRTLINLTRVVEVLAWGVIFCVVSLLENDGVGLTLGILIAFGALAIAGAARFGRAQIRRTAAYRTAYYGNRRISPRP